jgi:hypothetical protein
MVPSVLSKRIKENRKRISFPFCTQKKEESSGIIS